MKLCFSTIGCPEWYWEDILATAKDLGYHGLEIRGVRNEIDASKMRPFREEIAAGTRAQLSALGLSIACLDSSCELGTRSGRVEMMNTGLSDIDVASRLGVPYVRVLGDNRPAPAVPVEDALVMDAAGYLGEYAKDKGVTLLIESNGAYAETRRLRRLLDMLNMPNIAALWDVHHPYRYFQESPKTTYENIGPYIKHMHIKDSVMVRSREQYRIPGEGDIPLAEMIGLMEGCGYQGFYSMEWVKRWDLTLEEPGIVFANYVQFMNRGY